MNKIICAFSVAAQIAGSSGPAFSQVDSKTFCVLLAQYLTNPPSAFIAQRGQQTSDRKWKSKRDLPNASCTISLTKRATHIAQCIFNEGASAEVALSWYKTMESNVEECISKLPEHSQYRRDISDFILKDGTKVMEIEWENTGPYAYSSIEISRAVSPNGRRFTTMEFNYRKN